MTGTAANASLWPASQETGDVAASSGAAPAAAAAAAAAAPGVRWAAPMIVFRRDAGWEGGRGASAPFAALDPDAPGPPLLSRSWPPLA
jgi:hypothetical protein